MHSHEWPCRIKSTRRKRRLLKTDRDKQLIQLDKRQTALLQQKKLLPKVPLEQPYQRGWKRFFTLRSDLKQNPRAEFYETLLEKINTFQYHHNRSFKRGKRRKERYRYELKPQLLQVFSASSWYANRMKLTDDERSYFTRFETLHGKSMQIDVKYEFNEPWRFVLKVVPHMVTHIKLMDVDIERELSYIKAHIDNHFLWPRINLLTRGRRYKYFDSFFERPKYINRIKNIPRNSSKEAYLDLDI